MDIKLIEQIKKLAVNTPMKISKYLGEKEGCPKGVTCTV